MKKKTPIERITASPDPKNRAARDGQAKIEHDKTSYTLCGGSGGSLPPRGAASVAATDRHPLLLKPCHGPHASEPDARADSRAWPKCKAHTRMGRPRKQPNIFLMEHCKLLSRCRERTIRQCPTNYVRQARNVESSGNRAGCLEMLAEKSLWWPRTRYFGLVYSERGRAIRPV
jgi:hypothetical protein